MKKKNLKSSPGRNLPEPISPKVKEVVKNADLTEVIRQPDGLLTEHIVKDKVAAAPFPEVCKVLEENAEFDLSADNEELANSLYVHFQRLLEELLASTSPPLSDDPRRKYNLGMKIRIRQLLESNVESILKERASSLNNKASAQEDEAFSILKEKANASDGKSVLYPNEKAIAPDSKTISYRTEKVIASEYDPAIYSDGKGSYSENSTVSLRHQIAMAVEYSAKIYLRFPRADLEEIYLITGFKAPWSTEKKRLGYLKSETGQPSTVKGSPGESGEMAKNLRLKPYSDNPPLNAAETSGVEIYASTGESEEEASSSNKLIINEPAAAAETTFIAKKIGNILRIKSYQFGVRMIRLYQYLQHKREYTISSQIVRSGTSIGANVHEATKAESRADFIHKLMIAHKEMKETVFWLRLLKRGNYLPRGGYRSLRDDVDEIERILGKSIYTARKGKK